MRAPAGATTATIAGVPAYLWRHGCGPTAVGMVLGYLDTHGYPDLFPGDGSTQTADVNQGIASQGSGTRGSGLQLHYEDYSLPADGSSPTPDSSTNYPVGCHTNDSVGDFMNTSWSIYGNFYGWSWSSAIIPSFTSYVHLKSAAYVPASTMYYMGSTLTWSVLTTEIDHNRPMVFLVDSSSDGLTDHFVTIIGYSEGPPQQYACWDTWGTSIRWCEFRAMSSSYAWGVCGGWSFSVSMAPVVQVTFAAQTPSNGPGLVTLSNTVFDADGNTCQLEVLYSTNSAVSWTNAWILSATGTLGSVTISNRAARQIGNVVTTNAGGGTTTNNLTLVWNTTSNGMASVLCTNTRVRLRAWDGANWSGAVTSSPFRVDNIPRTLQVISAHGFPAPAVGIHTNNYGTTATNAVTGAETAGSTQYVAAAWTMTGNAPTGGTTTQFVMTVTNNAVLTWQWRTNYLLTVGVIGQGTVGVTNGWRGAGSNVTVTATPQAYYQFTQWTGDTNAITAGAVTAATVTVTMAGPVTLVGHFTEIVANQGTPEWWLAQYGLTNQDFNSEELKDTDGDGMPAWKEWVAGTDPTNPASRLAITDCRDNAGSNFVVHWLSASNRLYAVDRATNLLVFEFVPIATNLPATAPLNVHTDDTVNGVRGALYRVRVRPE